MLRDILRHHLLAIILADDVIALPTRQFNDTGEPLPRLRDVWESLAADHDYLALALVLLTPSQTFEGQTGAEWLREARAAEVLTVTDRIRRALEN